MEAGRSIWHAVIIMILAFGATAIVMFKVDPFKATALEKSLFYTSALIGIFGLIILIGSIIFKRNL